MKYQDLQLTLRNLSDLLFIPETFEITGMFVVFNCCYVSNLCCVIFLLFIGSYCESFRGTLGLKILFATIQQVVKVRLNTCRNLALLLEILSNSELKKDFLEETLNLCSAYWVLNWCCETVVQDHPQLVSLMQLLLAKPEISMQPMLLNTVWSVSQHLYPFFYFLIFENDV